MHARIVNRLSLAGLYASLVGNGIGRFAFIAMMPALIQAGWFSASEASYLGVANLVGYLIGACLTEALARRFAVSYLLRAAMLTCALSYLASAFEGAPMPWYYLLRTLAGVAGAMLMVLTAPVVLPHHIAETRGRVSGVVFSGIGLGAMLAGVLVPLLVSGFGLGFVVSGTLIPAMVFRGITGAWLGMGGICFVLTLLAWRHWPANAVTMASPANADAVPHGLRWVVGLILTAHALNAIGYLPHTMYWVDYVVRELKMPLATGGFFWAVFGAGAAAGPLLAGHLADAFGLKRCLVVGFLLKAVGVALPLFSNSMAGLFVSSLLVGLLTPGVVALISAYTLDCVGVTFHRRAWWQTTLAFATAQAIGALLMARAAAGLDSYLALFAVSAAALLGSAVCIACVVKPTTERKPIDPEEVSSAELAGMQPAIVESHLEVER